MATKTETKAKKETKPTTKSETSSKETAKDKATDSAGASESSPASKKSTAPAREISYFSSVSTDDYRDGWDSIFSARKKPARRKPRVAKAVAPAKIELNIANLDENLRHQLEAAFRAEAKKNRISYNKLVKAGKVNWQLTCELSE